MCGVLNSRRPHSTRTKFMIETLTNFKNNKGKSLPGGQGSVAGETTIKMKKFLGGLGKKRQSEWNALDIFFFKTSLLLCSHALIGLISLSSLGARTASSDIGRYPKRLDEG